MIDSRCREGGASAVTGRLEREGVLRRRARFSVSSFTEDVQAAIGLCRWIAGMNASYAQRSIAGNAGNVAGYGRQSI